MIKERLLITVLFVFIMLLSGCKKNLIHEKDLDFISFKPSDFLAAEAQTFHSEDETQAQYKFITDLLEYSLSQPVITDHQNCADFTVDLVYEDQSTRTFFIDLDESSQKAYLTEGEKTYSIGPDRYKQLIISPVFKDYMKQAYNTPEIKLLGNDMSTELAYVGKGLFHFKSFNNTTKSSNYTSQNTTVDELTINSASDFSLSITADQEPSEITENIYQEGELLHSFPLKDRTIILPNEEGHFTLELSCSWRDMPNDYFEGDATYQISISNDLPVTFNVTQITALPGDCFVITAQNVNEGQVLKVEAPFYEKEVTFIPYKNSYIAIMPISAWTEPQKYVLTTSTTEPSTGTEVKTEYPVEIAYKHFDIQHLTVAPSTLALQSQENIDSDAAYLKEARSNSRPEKLWESTFLQPVEGVITTEYSQTRYTNDNPVPSRHSGIDIATARGTPVKASNNGYVTMAMALYLTGNTVVVDHGMGIFTAYCHLDELSVEKGDTVKKGDLVGKVGTTGFSTGPHLHFTIYINGTYVNPWTFFERDLLDF